MPAVVRHHVVIAGVVGGLVLTVVLLAVCATCHQSRRERRRLRKLSTAVTDAQTSQQPDHRVHDVGGSASNTHNHRAYGGWTALANGGEYIQRDDGLLPGLTASRRLPDDMPHAAVVQIPARDRSIARQAGSFTSDTGHAVARPTRHGAVDKLGGVSCPNTVISAVATIEQRPTSTSTCTDREVFTPSPRSDVDRPVQRPPPSTSPRAVQAPAMTDTSPLGGRRIRPGWSASVRPTAGGAVAADRSSTGTLERPHDDRRQWQRPASVRWADAGSASRRPDTTARALLRSTPDLYYDVRPRLGATHSIVF